MLTRYLCVCALVLLAALTGCAGRKPPALPTPLPAPTALPPATSTAPAPMADPLTAVPTAIPPSPTVVPASAPPWPTMAPPTLTAAPTPLPPSPTAMPTMVPPSPTAAQAAAGLSAATRPVTPQARATTGTPAATPTLIPANQYPLAIPVERARAYLGSAITIEQALKPGANYARYIVSYLSDGLKIYALMTVPNGPKPASGWPVVVFNHGSIPPAQYVTTERYVAYQDAFARAGYISFKSDYRGHGKSEGGARGPFSSADYTADVLNAVASLKAYTDADPTRIGMWGHSMGGQITLRAMVISKDIKAGVVWAGTVASQAYELTHPRHPATRPTSTPGPFGPRGGRAQMLAQYGTPEQNPSFWNSISPNSYLTDLSGPLQLHHGLADETVPPVYSDLLAQEVKAAGKGVELYTYPGDNHNISNNFNTAMARSVAFMDKYVKGN